MVATQSFSISRRTLDLEDYIDIARRHAGWIAGPAFFGVVASVVVAFMLPNEYQSHATMEITPAQISETLLQTTINQALNERIQQMQTQITSRAVLSSIISDPHLNLYKDEIKAKPLDDVIDEMKSKMNIQIVQLPGAMSKRASAFEISFNYSNRYQAHDTVTALMNKFDELNLSTQKQQQEAVKGFVGDELTKAKADLNAANDALTVFRQGNAGKLPESNGLNLGMEGNLTEKIRSDGDYIFRDQQAINSLETQKNQVKARLDFYDSDEATYEATVLPGSAAARQNQQIADIEKNIETLKFNLEQERKEYSESYPDVKRDEKRLATFEQKHDQLMEEERVRKEAEAAKPKESVIRPPALVLKEKQMREDVKQQVERLDASISQYQQDIERLKTEQKGYIRDSDQLNQRLKESTTLEAPLEDLTRNQRMAESTYQDLLRKQQLADANGTLISRKAGENLEVLDVASLPTVPTSPNRPRMVGIGFAMSLVLGLGMAGIQEAKDTSLKNLKDVRAYTNLPVLCSIPLLENTMLVKRKRRLTYLAWSAAVILGAAAVSSAVVYYEQVTMKG